MPILDIQPEPISEEESKVLATRQMLSFLTVSSPESSERAPSKALFSLGALPDNGFTDGPELFNWTSRDIYDVDDRLLLRHHTIDLGSGNEWAVSVAATNLLRTPVWRVKAGPKLNEEALANNALRALQDTDLEPAFVEGEDQVRLIAHNYPRLGLLCQSVTNPDDKSVIDIGDLTIIPLSSRPQENMESATAVWSPYDIVVSSTFAHFRQLWERNLNSLPQLPQIPATRKDIQTAIEKARELVVEEKTTNPELRLSPQQTGYYCAAAAAQMILHHYSFCKTQEEIAKEMNISASGGAHLSDQVTGIAVLTGKALEAELDLSTSFCEAREEIRQNRPLKTSGPIHARACGGFKVETEDRNWLYLYNPWPSNQGSIYYEAWDANRHSSYMYVRPFLPG